MTRRRRLARLEGQRVAGQALEVWQEVEDAPGAFRQVFPAPGATGGNGCRIGQGEALRLDAIKARGVARVVCVTLEGGTA